MHISKVSQMFGRLLGVPVQVWQSPLCPLLQNIVGKSNASHSEKLKPHVVNHQCIVYGK
jgi:hypothetical protein